MQDIFAGSDLRLLPTGSAIWMHMIRNTCFHPKSNASLRELRAHTSSAVSWPQGLYARQGSFDFAPAVDDFLCVRKAALCLAECGLDNLRYVQSDGFSDVD